MPSPKKPPTELRLRVLSAIDYAPGDTARARIRAVADRTFIDNHSQIAYRFTWRTIMTCTDALMPRAHGCAGAAHLAVPL